MTKVKSEQIDIEIMGIVFAADETNLDGDGRPLRRRDIVPAARLGNAAPGLLEVVRRIAKTRPETVSNYAEWAQGMASEAYAKATT